MAKLKNIKKPTKPKKVPKPSFLLRINEDDPDNRYFEVIKKNGQIIAKGTKLYTTTNRIEKAVPQFIDQLNIAISHAQNLPVEDIPRKQQRRNPV